MVCTAIVPGTCGHIPIYLDADGPQAAPGTILVLLDLQIVDSVMRSKANLYPCRRGARCYAFVLH